MIKETACSGGRRVENHFHRDDILTFNALPIGKESEHTSKSPRPADKVGDIKPLCDTQNGLTAFISAPLWKELLTAPRLKDAERARIARL